MPRNSRKKIVGKRQENAELTMSAEFFKTLRRNIETLKVQPVSTLSGLQDSLPRTY
ncbi:hypothetical protein [Amycolatopsis sp. RTGN1]|uniref:hypothetical protein n=1 Tax=Amycolatopsis ponsaeliensis TaxID=2992142 RepID=UPI002550352F|nr:hypothetical protein [Amycolatopsis sp. RTGN1]